MDLYKQLSQNKKTIVQKWFDHLMGTYPPDTAQFLRSQTDAFANPVGQNSLESLEGLFHQLLSKASDRQKAQPVVDPIVRIRAIQDFTPSKAVGFVFELKDIIRRTIPLEKGDAKAWQKTDKWIDDLGLLAFDVYMQCREKIYELKTSETQKRLFNAFDRAGLMKGPDGDNSS